MEVSGPAPRGKSCFLTSTTYQINRMLKRRTSCKSLVCSSESPLESSWKCRSNNSSEKGCWSQGAMFKGVNEWRIPCGVNSLYCNQDNIVLTTPALKNKDNTSNSDFFCKNNNKRDEWWLIIILEWNIKYQTLSNDWEQVVSNEMITCVCFGWE